MSTNMQVDELIERPVPTVRALLLDAGFLERFAQLQHPEPGSVAAEIDPEQGTSRVSWTWVVTGSVPKIAEKFVGRQVFIEFQLRPDTHGTITVRARARRSAVMTGDLLLNAAADNTRLAVRGDIRVDAGVASRPLEKLAKEQLLLPILRDELVPLLRESSRGADGPA
jgi:hypothetical protein